MTDVELVALAKTGNQSAYTELYERHKKKIYFVASKILRNTAEAEEVIQLAFIKAFKGLDKFDGHSAFYTWLYRIAVREALQIIRDKRSKMNKVTDSLDEMMRKTSQDDQRKKINLQPCLEDYQLRGMLADKDLKFIMTTLKPGYRSVLHLRVIEGLSIKETAKVLNIDEGTVKSQYRKGLLRARKIAGGKLSPQEKKALSSYR